MHSLDQSGASSPDPLAISQDGSSPLKPKCRRTPPRKALGITTGNVQSHRFHITTPNSTAAEKTSAPQDLSPWRIQVTVQAEQTRSIENHHEPQTSPSRIFAERTVTTKVPIKSGDEAPIRQRSSRGTPKHPRISRATSISPSRSPAYARSKKSVRSPNKTALMDSPSPIKRGRGRPRKSVVASDTPLSSHRDPKAHDNEPGALLGVVEAEDLHRTVQTKSDVGIPAEGNTLGVDEDVYEYDSILDSEGFSMVSVSSIPSTQGEHRLSSIAKASSSRVTPYAPKGNITPSTGSGSLRLPFPPKPAPVEQEIREIEKPNEGTPRLARVVRAGIALQGVLNPGSSNHGSPLAQRKGSSPLDVATSPKDRLDKLFNGFGLETQRELRAGLRLGEELARRQTQANNPPPSIEVDKDVFGPDPKISYPQLPGVAASHSYGVAATSSANTGSPPFFNAQLPSPSDSDVDANDERMSWKYDTMREDGRSSLNPGSVEARKSPIDRTMLAREAEWQREREAISKQIENANASQVIVIDDSDDENLGGQVACSSQVLNDEDADIWQEEAYISADHPSSADVLPIFLQQEPRKPRRSQLPSPWTKKSQDVSVTTAELDHEDLFWQPKETSAIVRVSACPDVPVQYNSSLQTPPSSQRDQSKDGVQSMSNDKPAKSEVKEQDNPSKHPQTSRPLHQNNRKDRSESNLEHVVIQNEGLEKLEPEISVDEDEKRSDISAQEEDIDTTILSHDYMLGDATGPLDEGTELDVSLACMTTMSITGSFEEVPEPQTPLATLPSPKPSTSKHVRFTDEVFQKAVPKGREVKEAPLPPAPSSWISRAISYLPTLGSSAPTTIPLPASPKRIIQLSRVDKGPLPLYLPWRQAHWWALIHITRQSQADPAALIQFSSTASSAKYLGTVVSVHKWSKKITKQDCALVERFCEVLEKRGTVKGVEATAVEGGKSQWGRRPGQWIGKRVVLSALVAQWACDVQDGLCTVGWSDRTGLKSGSKTEMWSKADLPVDGPGVAYELS
ncbi:MAG: hypothetical protein Q9220_003200 [cf. Caloplaca sp. 1 TL-2023]